ncbi:Serine/threonine-protein kinase-like protein CCR4 [Acorus calamus]|uniref:Serine/threonine-protein kinase-like protein CCR4 n=1 Tax=Acorus calamus TaxID=4465 RepID=A0AAV9CIC8_ACOCL|nr:Serine/threonine-protein kinase-like protein CCR4 [Acorus calamus]
MSFPPLLLLLLLFFFSSLNWVSSDPLSTFSVSRVNTSTVVCALLPTSHGPVLNCTALGTHAPPTTYPHRGVPYSAIAAGDAFLCGLTTTTTTSSMRWWEFTHDGSVGPPKRVYRGPALSSLSAGDAHVCGLNKSTGGVVCWRWRELGRRPISERRLTAVAVGKDFLCGLSAANGTVVCVGGEGGGTMGAPKGGGYSILGAGTRHACALSAARELTCWGDGPAASVNATGGGFVSLALGEDRTCALRGNGTAACWGADGFGLPIGLRSELFINIEGRGRVFCGVLTVNYSLVCWGRGNDTEAVDTGVFKRVLPGTCRPQSECGCGVLGDSGSVCNNGVICQTCVPSTASAPPPTNPDPSNGSDRRRLVLIIVGAAGVAVFLAAGSGFAHYRLRGERKSRVHDSGRLDRDRPPRSNTQAGPMLDKLLSMGRGGSLEKFLLQELYDATGGFSDAHRIGSGSFGGVYRGVLSDGREVAMKRSEPGQQASTSYQTPGRPIAQQQQQRDKKDKECAFLSELAALSRLNHKNLVRLFGYCSEGAERILVYEFVANGSLYDHLFHGDQPGPIDSWAIRLRIALDAARGIEYLHTYAVPPIVHRDIKSSNILLDSDWTAKVADFGLSRKNPDGSCTSGADVEAGGAAEGPVYRAAGTVGYMDPEYYRLQRLTTKSDVYSFGVVLLELLTGLKAVHWDEEARAPRNVVDCVEEEEVHCPFDWRIPPPTPAETEAVGQLGYIAATCVRLESCDRPTMTDVVAGLERALLTCLELECLSRSTTGNRSST